MSTLVPINKLTQWIETIDPYYISRITLRKGLYIATWLTMVNVILKPNMFLAFSMSAIAAFGCYQAAVFDTLLKKYKALTAAISLFTSASLLFYFLFPYKFYLMIFALMFYIVVYWLVYYTFPEFKSFITSIFAFSSFMTTVIPSATLQIGANIFYCCMLSLVIIVVALSVHPNLYHHVWYRATKKYIQTLEVSIENSIYQLKNDNYMRQIAHSDTIRNFKHLLPRRKLLSRLRINFYIRNINLAIKYVYYLPKNNTFWLKFKEDLCLFRKAMENNQPCTAFTPVTTDNRDELFAQKNLLRAIDSWNTLCTQH